MNISALKKNMNKGMSVIPVLWEVKAKGSQIQARPGQFSNLGHVFKFCFVL